MDIKDRIKLIMERENMLSGAFADSIGVQQSTLSHILNGRNNPSLDVVMKIHQRYSYINMNWLLYGTENMSERKNTNEDEDWQPSLFDQAEEITAKEPEHQKKSQEMPLESIKKPSQETVIQDIKYIERPQRKITEIRIFFDDNTYETFRGDK